MDFYKVRTNIYIFFVLYILDSISLSRFITVLLIIRLIIALLVWSILAVKFLAAVKYEWAREAGVSLAILG